MSNEIIEKYSKLNDDGKFFVDCALNAAVDNPEYRVDLSDEEKKQLDIKKEQERERKKENQIKDAKFNEFYENLKEESTYFTSQDYINSLNELHSIMPLEELRYFYLFTHAKHFM